MIEMLGVLAIIGVLSAGGIFAYSTAMENYRVNKTIDDLNNMISVLESIVGSGRVKASTYTLYLPYELHALGVIPDNIYNTANPACQPKNSCSLKNYFGGSLDINYREGLYEDAISQKFNVHIKGISKSSCIKLVRNKDKQKGANLLSQKGWTTIHVFDSSGTYHYANHASDANLQRWCDNNQQIHFMTFLRYKGV